MQKKAGNIANDKHDAAILWSEAFLLLKARASRRVANWLKRTTTDGEFVYEDFKLNLDLLVDTMIERAGKRDPATTTVVKHFRHGTIRRNFVRHYMEQYKTQLELKILTAMFGYEFIPFRGDTMGNLYFNAADRDLVAKIGFLKDMLEPPTYAALLGHGQSHWMVLHSLYKAGGSAGQQYVLGINDPLGSSTRMQLKNLDSSYLIYFFSFNEKACRAGMDFLESILYL